MRQTFSETTYKIIESDPRVTVLLGDIGVHSFRKTFADFPNNILNVGILEQAMVGAAAGLAAKGLVPIVHTIAPFIVERALEQIKVDLAYQDLGANLVSVGGSYDYAGLGSTHHCPGDVGILSNVPEIEIYTPGSRTEFASQFQSNYDNKKVSYFRLSEKTHKENFSVSSLGGAVLKEGSSVSVLVVGPMIVNAIEALKDTDATIIYINSVRPIDLKLIDQNTKSKLMIVSNLYQGTVTQFLLPIINTRPIQIMEIGTPRVFLRNYGSLEEHDKKNGLDILSIRENYLRFIES